ncbi:MAG: serine hydrolase, partial [Sphingobium sp.]
EAAQTVSDNAAANLLLARIGGPAGMTRFWRDLGDDVSRLDRNEPALNTSRGADIRDTSTPAAMARSMAAILTGKVMSTGSRERLIGWMAATKTGAGRLRVGLPAGWRAGDKTGTSGSSPDAPAFVNDIAAVWRPDGTPCFVTCFYDAPAGTSQGDREAVLAEVGRIAGGWMSA